MQRRLVLLAAILMALSCAPASARDEAPVRVASYNILADRYGPGWAQRRDAVNGFLAEGAFDIVAIQEATEHQIGDLAIAQPKLAYIVGERSDGHRGDQGWYEFNPIFYRADRFALLDHSSFWASETPSIPGSLLPETKKHGRVITWARLEDRRNGKRLLVVSVHIHGMRGSEEVAIILDQLARHHAGEPILLLGDFNFEPGSPGYRQLVTSGRFKDGGGEAPSGETSTLIGPDGFTLDGAPGGAKTRKVGQSKRLDYVFACGFDDIRHYRRSLVRLAVPGPFFASDHHAISAELAIGDRCALDPRAAVRQPVP